MAGAQPRADTASRGAQPRGAQPKGVPPKGVPRGGWGLPLAVVIVGMFMSVLDVSIVNVAIPRMQKEFGTATENIQWITTAYTLCLGVVVPTSAWLGERLGLRRLYLLSLVAFAFTSALCGMAWDLNSMIIFRVLQAVPGGVIPVTCLTLLYRMVPRRKLGTAMGMYGLGIVVAPGIGPTLGGYLVDYVSWRLIFYINVPVGVLGAIAAMLVLPRFPRSARYKFDVPGFLCIAAGLSALLLALTKAEDWGWGCYRTLMLICAGLLLLALFVVVELEVAQPLLDLRVFTSWPYVNSLLLIAVLSVGLFAVLFYVPLFLQEGQQVTAMNTGLTVLPQALVLMVMMPLAGRLYDRIGPRWPAVVGLAVCGIGSLLMADIEADVPRPDLVAWTMIRAAGLGLAMMPVMTGGIDALPASAVNSGSAFNTLVQRVTAALGLAVLTALMTSEQAQLMADRAALVQSKGGQTDPRIQLMEHAGPSGVLSLARQLELQAQAQAYGDVFYVVAWFTLAGAVFALFLRSGSASGDRAGAEAERA